MSLRNLLETSSTTKRGLHRQSISLLERKVVKLTHLKFPSSQGRWLNGPSSTLIWKSMKTFAEEKKKKTPKTKTEKRSQPRSFKFTRKTLSTPVQWNDASRSWNAWSFKMPRTKSSISTDIMRTTPWILTWIMTANYCLFGALALKSQRKRMLQLLHGTPSTQISSPLLMVAMTSWSQWPAWFVASLSRTQPGLNFHSKLSPESCVLIAILPIPHSLLLDVTTVQSWSLISDLNPPTSLSTSQPCAPTSTPTQSGKLNGKRTSKVN